MSYSTFDNVIATIGHLARRADGHPVASFKASSASQDPARGPVEYVVPRIKLNDLTHALMKERNLPYGQAFARVQQTYPDLARAYADELRGRR